MKTSTMTKKGSSSKASASPKKAAPQKVLKNIGGTSLDPENATLDPDKFMTQFLPMEEEVANRAYKIWQEQGCPEGCEQEHWHKAQQEIASLGPRSLTA